jgi:hypothetical protein
VELNFSFHKNLISKTDESLQNFRKALSTLSPEELKRTEFLVFRKNLQSPEDIIEKGKKLFSLFRDESDFSRMSVKEKESFFQTTNYRVDPYYCAIGYASALAGCADFASRCEFIGVPPDICEAGFILCYSMALVDLENCLNGQ